MTEFDMAMQDLKEIFYLIEKIWAKQKRYIENKNLLNWSVHCSCLLIFVCKYLMSKRFRSAFKI